MGNKSLRILILSTYPPTHSANLGGDIMEALQCKGHSVDFVCRYSDSELEGITHRAIERHNPTVKTILKSYFHSKRLEQLLSYFYRLKHSNKNKKGLVYPNEAKPALNPNKLITFVGKQEYNLIITLFWVDMLNSTSLKSLYDEYKCPILIYSVDMAPMTGGCYYFNECNNFMTGCGNCILLDKPHCKDQSNTNYKIKKSNYSKINCSFVGNTWMNNYAFQSGLLEKEQIYNASIVLDETIFNPGSQLAAKTELGISYDKDFILFARSWDLKRKRPEYIIQSIYELWLNMDTIQRSRFLVITVGDNKILDELSKFDIPILNFGFVNREKLILLYQSATFFLSASTDDAGPSMVNQSIMCGTPVICFNNGTAMDVISNGISGFKTDEITASGFSIILRKAHDSWMNNQFPNLRETTRNEALKHCSKKTFVDTIENIYRQVNHNGTKE